jgi:hypothetical protein
LAVKKGVDITSFVPLVWGGMALLVVLFIFVLRGDTGSLKTKSAPNSAFGPGGNVGQPPPGVDPNMFKQNPNNPPNEQPQQPQDQPPTLAELQGVWAQANMRKFLLGDRAVFVYFDGRKITSRMNGGTFSLQGNMYKERLEFGSGDQLVLVGKEHTLSVKMQGDQVNFGGTLSNGSNINETLTRLAKGGVGNGINGVWENTADPNLPQLMYINDGYFLNVVYDRAQKTSRKILGGTYSHAGNSFKGRIEYCTDAEVQLLEPQEQALQVQNQGNQLIFTGTLSNGKQINETYSRVQ